VGGVAVGRWCYERPSELGIGVEAGYLLLRQAHARSVALYPIGLAVDEANKGSLSETLMLSAGLLGASGAIRLGRTLPVILRLGAGVVAGVLGDRRGGGFDTTARQDDDGTAIHPVEHYDIDVAETSLAALFHAAPEARLAFPLGNGIELDLGVRGFALFALNQPAWRNDELVLADGDGVAKLPDDTLTSRVSLVLSPGVGFRSAF
jgi:hypothetical protein